MNHGHNYCKGLPEKLHAKIQLFILNHCVSTFIRIYANQMLESKFKTFKDYQIKCQIQFIQLKH